MPPFRFYAPFAFRVFFWLVFCLRVPHPSTLRVRFFRSKTSLGNGQNKTLAFHGRTLPEESASSSFFGFLRPCNLTRHHNLLNHLHPRRIFQKLALNLIHARYDRFLFPFRAILPGKRQFNLDPVRQPLQRNIAMFGRSVAMETVLARLYHRCLQSQYFRILHPRRIRHVPRSSARCGCQSFIRIHLQQYLLAMGCHG
jgi:hypothetical protein